MATERIRTIVTKEDVVSVLETIIEHVKHSMKVNKCEVNIEYGMKETCYSGLSWFVQKEPDGQEYITMDMALVYPVGIEVEEEKVVEGNHIKKSYIRLY